MSESIDEQMMGEALALARQAFDAGEVPIGAVVVLDGQIVAQGALPPEVTTFLDRWADNALETRDRFRVPLLRNRAMVNAVTRCGADVLVLALRAHWAQTNGTAHTARLAREAGLCVMERMCWVSHAPMRGQP